MGSWPEREALLGDATRATYGELCRRVDSWHGRLDEGGIRGVGRVVAFSGDHGVGTVSLLLALVERGCVAVPLSSTGPLQRPDLLAISQAEILAHGDGTAGSRLDPLEGIPDHPLLGGLRSRGHGGLVLFTSGSTGKPKAVLHDIELLLEKFRRPRKRLRMLTFLLLDHIGGVNTLFYALANGGTVITVSDRRAETVCRAIESHRVEVLPTTPTFLNLLLLSAEHRRHDLSSLRLITYGTEVMPAHTLQRIQEVFPQVRLQQTYGLSELGILRSKSREDGSLWVKVGGEGFETKVVDGVLWIRSHSNMLGYLNAPSPFDAEGWFNTEDAVEQDGEWLRILGRTSDIINVGGQKVYPAEVESVLLEMEGVEDVTVRGVANPLMGQTIVATFNLSSPEAAGELKARMWRHCRDRMQRFMIPLKVEITQAEQYGPRLKRQRGSEPA